MADSVPSDCLPPECSSPGTRPADNSEVGRSALPGAAAGGAGAAPDSTQRRVSGAKYVNADGVRAVRDGIRPHAGSGCSNAAPKPAWLRVRLPGGERYEVVRQIVQANHLHTVCAESKCPNIAECWGRGTATLMLLGDVCTRACRFCAVATGNPQGRLDPAEPLKVARAVELMGLRYVVLTSVDRDDLDDGGAGHYAACIRAIHQRVPQASVEALTPDFAGVMAHVAVVLDAGLVTFAQNIETVERLTSRVRDPRAGYRQTLDVLAFAKRHAPATLTKTSLMLGLGETDAELEQALDDMRAANVDIVTLGQYMRPTAHHLPVERFVPPDEFRTLRELALRKGFIEAVAGPLVRSSYRAERVLEQNNAGL